MIFQESQVPAPSGTKPSANRPLWSTSAVGKRMVAPAVLSVLFALTAFPAQAATRYWNGGSVDIAGNGDGISDGVSGTWNTTLMNISSTISRYLIIAAAAVPSNAIAADKAVSGKVKANPAPFWLPEGERPDPTPPTKAAIPYGTHEKLKSIPVESYLMYPGATGVPYPDPIQFLIAKLKKESP